MTNFISGCQGAAGCKKMKVMKATIAMQYPAPACDDGPRRNWRGVIWEPVMSTGMRAMMATMLNGMRMKRKTHRKSRMDEHRIWRTDLRPNDVDWYEGEVSDDADADEEEDTFQANYGSTQNVED
jgi:hypothetical protein